MSGDWLAWTLPNRRSLTMCSCAWRSYSGSVQSAYSLSKLVGETIADQYVRWVPDMKILSYRFSNVIDVERECSTSLKASSYGRGSWLPADIFRIQALEHKAVSAGPCWSSLERVWVHRCSRRRSGRAQRLRSSDNRTPGLYYRQCRYLLRHAKRSTRSGAIRECPARLFRGQGKRSPR